MLRSRASRREDPWDAGGLEPVAATASGAADPEQEALLADSVGVAMLVVLETLTPVERLAFVLHDMFAVPFDEIAPIVGRSPAAARQLASRARRRIQADPSTPDGDTARQQRVVDAFLAASRSGDFDTLLTMLDPDVVMRVDAAAQRFGSPAEMRGSIARGFVRRVVFIRQSRIRAAAWNQPRRGRACRRQSSRTSIPSACRDRDAPRRPRGKGRASPGCDCRA